MPDASADSAVDSARKILRELESYDESLYQKPRWLVLNKLDLVAEDEQQDVVDEITAGLDWSGPVHAISALNKQGVDRLCHDIMSFLEDNESL
jgi:GTP-binding protein